MTAHRIAGVVAAVLLSSACAASHPAPPSPAPSATACEDPVYQRLRATEPDSLSQREYGRLQALEQACRDAASSRQPRAMGMHGRSMWLWMPAVMTAGGMMALMMRW